MENARALNLILLVFILFRVGQEDLPYWKREVFVENPGEFIVGKETVTLREIRPWWEQV